jgi:hypothetical protein
MMVDINKKSASVDLVDKKEETQMQVDTRKKTDAVEIVFEEPIVEEINEGYVDNLIGKEFESNPERAEMLREIFYDKDLNNLSDDDKQFLIDLKSNPAVLSVKHRECLINGKSLKQRHNEMAQESYLRLVVRNIENDIVWNEDLLEKTKNDRKKINYELTQAYKNKSNIIDELKELRSLKASKEDIAKKEAEFYNANITVGEAIARKKEINTKINSFEEKLLSLQEELAFAKSDLTAYVTEINAAEIAYAEKNAN